MKNIRFALYRFKRRVINSSRSLFSWRDKIPYFLGIRKAESGSMPDFIIAGLPKCGTVWLVEALNSNNNFEYVKNPFFSHKGEIRFFSLNFNQPILKYLNTFKVKKSEHPDKLLFEKSPDYSRMGKRRIELIKKLNAQVKIILIFRDPVERAFSNAKMDLIRVRQIELIPDNDHYFFSSYKSQIGMYNYERILTQWFSVFEKSQILILSMEDIKEKPNEVLKKTHYFLNREFSENYKGLEKRKNVTKAIPIPESHRTYLERSLSKSVNFWRNNQSLFRL